MENNEMTVYEDQPGFADDALVRIADQAEKRIDAVIKIKQVALKVTNGHDWVDQGGKPYLQVSGAEKIANLFNISWRINEPIFEMEEDGHYTYSYMGTFSMAGRSIQIEGSRSSNDPFFKQYNWDNKTKTERAIHERDNKRDVKMAALTNLLGNGITRLLGIRNLTYADLEAFAGIKQSDIGRVEYKKDGKNAGDSVKKKTTTQAQTNGAKSMTPEEQLRKELFEYCGEDEEAQKAVLKQISFFETDGGGKWIEDIEKASDKWVNSSIGKLRRLEKKEKPEPGTDLPDGCTKDPESCASSGFISEDGKMVAYCGGTEKRCLYGAK